MKDCDEYRRMADDYTGGRSDPEAAAELEKHLSGCRACREYTAALKEMKRLTAAAAEEVPAGLHERVMGAVRAERRKQRRGSASRLRVSRIAAGVCAAVFVLCGVSAALLGGLLSRSAAKTEDAQMYDTFTPQMEKKTETAAADDVAESLNGDRWTDGEKADIVIPAEEAAAEMTEENYSYQWTSEDGPGYGTANETAGGKADAAPTEASKKGGVRLDEGQVVWILLIMSGLLALASFAAFIISLSAIRKYRPEEKNGLPEGGEERKKEN